MLNYVRRHGLMQPGDRVGVAVSGGADSVGLLRLLLEARAELGIVLSVVHFHHKIRGAEADADEQFVRELARAFDLELHSDSGDTPAFARDHKMSLEAAARKLRYGFFDRLTGGSTVHRVATAHTLDDQAETVLMRFLRGSGTKGLAGIYPGAGGWISASVTSSVRKTGDPPTAVSSVPAPPPAPRIVRPLLEVGREELRLYLQQLGQTWHEDASNADTGFTRNRVRHEILPLLRQLNPNLEQVLSETAEIAREEENWWHEQTSAQPDLWAPRSAQPGLSVPPKMWVDVLLSKPVALQRRLIRMMAEGPDVHLEFRHVEAVRRLAAEEARRAERVVELPNGYEAVRRERELWFRHRRPITEGPCYTLALDVPGECEVAGRKIRASLTRDLGCGGREKGPYVRAVVLDSALRGLSVRNWRAGDCYWPAHTKEAKKLKELLQSPHIPREQKPYWPVVTYGEVIVWVPGFAAPERFQARESAPQALLLEEVLLPVDPNRS
ncbi:MAG TPA: tRNA lysidine(34) synthetase TilS [Terriglobales bacterium]|nr:tRNA lysidine(34) synthetase TilS [Terriglobales bacterium]